MAARLVQFTTISQGSQALCTERRITALKSRNGLVGSRLSAPSNPFFAKRVSIALSRRFAPADTERPGCRCLAVVVGLGHFPASLLRSRISRARREGRQSWPTGRLTRRAKHTGLRRGGIVLANQDNFGEVAVEVDAVSAFQGVDPDALLQADVGEVGGVVEKLSVRVLEESAEGSYVDVSVALGSEEVAVGGKSPSVGVKFLGSLDGRPPVSAPFAVRQL